MAAAMILKPGGGKSPSDSANSPVQVPADTSKVVSSGAPATPPVNQLNQPLSSTVDDTLAVLERRMNAVDITGDSAKVVAAARPILEKAVDLNAKTQLQKLRRALIMYDANLGMGNKAAACDAMLSVADFALTVADAPSKTKDAMDYCK